MPGDIQNRVNQAQQWMARYGLGMGDVDQNVINGILNGEGQWQPKLDSYLGDIARKKKESNLLTDNPAALGGDYNYISGYIKDILSKGLPGKDQLVQQGRAAIDTATNTAAQRTKENLASSGLFRSGVGQGAISNVYGAKAGAYGALESDIAGKELAYKDSAIKSLLGLNEFAGGQYTNLLNSERNYDLTRQQMAQQQSMFQKQLDASQPGFLDFLGQILSGGAQVGAAALLAPAAAASDKKLKENIVYTGEKTKTGIPIAEYNFKGSKIRIKGVIAQDVEKVMPEAVFKVVDLMKVPEAQYEIVE